MADDVIWKNLMRGVSWEDQYGVWRRGDKRRFGGNDNQTFKVVEDATGKIVAVTNLLYPHPQLEKQKSQYARPCQCPNTSVVQGVDQELAQFVFGRLLESPREFGYDPEQHFRRRGTYVLPEYQRRGFGTMLTRYCNAIADHYGRATYLPATEKAFRLFENNGFAVLGTIEVDMSRYGEDVQAVRVYRRDPLS